MFLYSSSKEFIVFPKVQTWDHSVFHSIKTQRCSFEIAECVHFLESIFAKQSSIRIMNFDFQIIILICTNLAKTIMTQFCLNSN